MDSQPKNWEVELKFHIDSMPLLEDRLQSLGFHPAAIEQHEDLYFRHPCRDFKQTDEAFRLRRINQSACLTYKGPRQLGSVKTREEIELDVDGASVEDWKRMLLRLGFQAVIPVRKRRQIFESQASEFSHIHVTIDAVEHLGNFAEIETLVGDAEHLESEKNRILTLSRLLGLDRLEPKSYLGLLLAHMQDAR
jgi:adenylate cyclase class 2